MLITLLWTQAALCKIPKHLICLKGDEPCVRRLGDQFPGVQQFKAKLQPSITATQGKCSNLQAGQRAAGERTGLDSMDFLLSWPLLQAVVFLSVGFYIPISETAAV